MAVGKGLPRRQRAARWVTREPSCFASCLGAARIGWISGQGDGNGWVQTTWGRQDSFDKNWVRIEERIGVVEGSAREVGWVMQLEFCHDVELLSSSVATPT